MHFPAAFSMLRCETYITVIIRTCFTAHLSWLICQAQSVSGLPTGGEWYHAPSHSTQYPCATCRSTSSSSQPPGLISGCSNLSWSLPRMFSSENVVPLLCDSVPGNSEDVMAAKNEDIRESMGSLDLRTKTTAVARLNYVIKPFSLDDVISTDLSFGSIVSFTSSEYE
jgi:hypothetical protein